MRVMVLVRATKDSEAGTLPDEKLLTDMGRYNEELVKAGIMLAGEGLHPSVKGKRIQFSGGRRTVVDGPFSETKELIAGYWLWQVKSMEEAVEWARRCPIRCPARTPNSKSAHLRGRRLRGGVHPRAARAGRASARADRREEVAVGGLLPGVVPREPVRELRDALRQAGVAELFGPPRKPRVGPRQRSSSTSEKSGASVRSVASRLKSSASSRRSPSTSGGKSSIGPWDQRPPSSARCPGCRDSRRPSRRPGRGSRGSARGRRRTSRARRRVADLSALRRSTCTTRSPTTHCARSLSGVQMQTCSTARPRPRARRRRERVVGLELDHRPDDDAHRASASSSG